MRSRITLPHIGLRRRPATALLGVAITMIVSLMCSASALAVTNLEGWLQDDPVIMANPTSVLQQLRTLGVTRIRLTVRWDTLSPASGSKTMPHGFNGANPASYSAKAWAPYDAVVRAAAADGIKVNFDLAGPEPVWAAGPGHPNSGRGEVEWQPNDADYTAFVKGVATRYSGSYKPSGAATALPRISFWTIWNEPNYGAGLTPQALPSNQNVFAAPTIYRHLVNDGWTALHQTGHGGDTIVIGEITPRGNPNPQQPHSKPSVFGNGILPIPFVQQMYCLGANYKPVRGSLATQMQCPTNGAGTARFRSQNPALFAASGFSVHPYSRYFPPNVETPNDKYYASFADLGNLTSVLDKSNAAYHSGKKFPIWNTEYGYITSPPKPHYDPIGKTYYASVTDAADYINFAEYLSYKNPRVMNYMQYLLIDPEQPQGASNDYGGYASGLEAFNGKPKLTFNAYQMPLYLPKLTSGSDEVWGDVRPARYAMMDQPSDPEAVTIRFTPRGSSTPQTLGTIPLNNAYGYYDTHLSIPGAGTVQAVWQFPSNDLRLLPGQYATSRPVTVS